MCTLIIAREVFQGSPLVVAANRDERLDRPSEPPRMRDPDWGILAPRDLQRGGSWIGVNRFGLFSGLTNRLDTQSVRGRMSRGELVMQALRHRTAAEALVDLRSLRGNELNGFHLIIADSRSIFLLKGDGKIIERSSESYKGILVVTNHGVGRMVYLGMPRRVELILRLWQKSAAKPAVENMKSLLEIHDEPALVSRRYGTCIQESENNYGTKSSSIIIHRTGISGPDAWLYSHRERKSIRREVCREKFDPEIKLSIEKII